MFQSRFSLEETKGFTLRQVTWARWTASHGIKTLKECAEEIAESLSTIFAVI